MASSEVPVASSVQAIEPPLASDARAVDRNQRSAS